MSEQEQLPALEKWTEGRVALALRKKYEKHHACLTQVRNHTGFSQSTRTADFMAIGLWPSRGIHLHGFEIKVSRSDWQAELKAPAKAEEISRHCHFWWLAVPDKGIVKVGELPEPWGLVEVSDSGVKVIKQAPFKESVDQPSWTFVASILRNVDSGNSGVDDVRKIYAKEIKAAKEEGFKSGERCSKSELERVSKKLSDLQRHVEAFEAASGIRLDRYSEHFNGEIGRAVKALRQGVSTADVDRYAERLRSMADELSSVKTAVCAVITSAVQQPEQARP